jgi:hypothetical protein
MGRGSGERSSESSQQWCEVKEPAGGGMPLPGIANLSGEQLCGRMAQEPAWRSRLAGLEKQVVVLHHRLPVLLDDPGPGLKPQARSVGQGYRALLRTHGILVDRLVHHPAQVVELHPPTVGRAGLQVHVLERPGPAVGNGDVEGLDLELVAQAGSATPRQCGRRSSGPGGGLTSPRIGQNP